MRIMNLRTVLLLVVALGAAGFTAYFAHSWILDQKDMLNSQAISQDPVDQIPVGEVLVAREDLPTGTFVKADLLEWQRWPKEGIKDGYVVKDSGAEKALEGAVVRTHLFAGEPITDSRVIHPGDRGFLAAVLEEGKRAVSVPVDATTGIAGFVFPGDWVDIILTFKKSVEDPSDEEKRETRYFSQTLLSGVRVLAIDQKVESADGSAQVAKTATVEVTAKQAEEIAIAMSIGSLSLSLRSLVKVEEPADGAAETAETAAVVATETATTETEQPTDRSYTRDIDVYYMRGDPLGIPTSSVASKVTVLRGSESGEVKF